MESAELRHPPLNAADEPSLQNHATPNSRESTSRGMALAQSSNLFLGWAAPAGWGRVIGCLAFRSPGRDPRAIPRGYGWNLGGLALGQRRAVWLYMVMSGLAARTLLHFRLSAHLLLARANGRLIWSPLPAPPRPDGETSRRG